MPFFLELGHKMDCVLYFSFSFYHNVFTLYFSLNFLIIDNEIIFKIKVTINNINPKAKAERVSGELNSKSPTKRVYYCNCNRCHIFKWIPREIWS